MKRILGVFIQLQLHVDITNTGPTVSYIRVFTVIDCNSIVTDATIDCNKKMPNYTV